MNRLTRAVLGIAAALVLIVGTPFAANAAKPAPPEPVTYGTSQNGQFSYFYLTEDHTTYLRAHTICYWDGGLSRNDTDTDWELFVGTMPRKSLTITGITPDRGSSLSAPFTVTTPGTYVLGTTHIPVSRIAFDYGLERYVSLQSVIATATWSKGGPAFPGVRTSFEFRVTCSF